MQEREQDGVWNVGCEMGEVEVCECGGGECADGLVGVGAGEEDGEGVREVVVGEMRVMVEVIVRGSG